MRRPVYRSFLVLAASLAVLSTAGAVPQRTVRLAPRPELGPGTATVAVIVGLKPGVSLEAASAVGADTAEAEQRSRRLAAERAVSAAVSPSDFTPTRYFENFPVLAGRASPGGAIALASRPDVAWVVFDGVKHLNATSPALQPMQLLVRSPRANGLGFTGQGQAVAVLDTGVDYTVPELGGAAFPNAKVVGGTNTADHTADPRDCAGHGTSVAAIIAGTAGIAPDAKIVAVKVFSACEEFAFDSDILAGIDFAIANRARFSIAAINMSLGAEISDGTALGYCDTIEPQYAAAFDAARAAGIAVVVASGNGGTSSALSSPACVASAISVGAVYSQQISSVDWGICRDDQIQPDTPTCFSNSNSNLSLLAPGAFWDVVTVGGVLQSFSGTSAAAPAVAGGVALLKQARPTLSPAGLANLLSATGKPVRTPADGLLTPRIDLFAATQLASANLVTYSGGPVPIPDGTGSGTATVTVSGFTGPLGSVQALVSIDHPDPTQLQLTLAGPDGTTVLLHDHSGSPEHPINTVYGRTGASANALMAFEGKTANGVWTLTVSDTVPDQTGSIRAFSLSLVPGQPHVPVPALTDGFVIPSVARADTDHLSSADLRLYNPGAAPKDLQLFFVPKGQTGALAVRSTRSVGAGQVLALNDVLFSEFGYTEAAGQLTIISGDANFFVTSRSFQDSTAGTFGTLVPGQPIASALAPGARATLPALTRTTFFHSDAGFVEVSGAQATVLFTVTDAAGTFLGSSQQIALPNQFVLFPDPIRYLGLALTDSYRVDATVVSGTGAVVPVAWTTDDRTTDPAFEAAVAAAPASSDDWIVPLALSISAAIPSPSSASSSSRSASPASTPPPGLTGLKTDLTIVNLGGAPANVTVSVTPAIIATSQLPPHVAPPAQTFNIGPGQTLTRPDVLRNDFPGAGNVGALRIHTDSPSRLAITARIVSVFASGTYALTEPAVPQSSALAAGGTATSIHMDQNSQTATSFSFIEVSGNDAVVHVSVVNGLSGAELGSKDYSVGAGNEIYVGDASDILGTATASNIYLRFSISSGAGQVVACGVATDIRSADSILVIARNDP
jgi:subtilisin family serine protease